MSLKIWLLFLKHALDRLVSPDSQSLAMCRCCTEMLQLALCGSSHGGAETDRCGAGRARVETKDASVMDRSPTLIWKYSAYFYFTHSRIATAGLRMEDSINIGTTTSMEIAADLVFIHLHLLQSTHRERWNFVWKPNWKVNSEDLNRG